MKKKTFIERFRFKYRVSILNENTLEEAWHARMSRMSVFMWTGLLMTFTFVILTLFILYTPLKYYLPGFSDSTSVRSEIMQEAFRIDSLTREMELQSQYVAVVRSIVSGEISVDSIPSDSILMKERALISLEKSKLEQDFSDKYEDEARYSLPLIASKQDAKAYSFFKPVNGIVSSKFSAIDDKYYVTFTTEKKESVVSVLMGTVLFTSFTIDNDWVIAVQHKDNYVSIYKNISHLLKKSGDVVKAGEAIAIIESGQTANKQFQFEIWKEGVAIDPQDVIAL